MDEIWERAVEMALDGQTDHAAVRNLTLDGAVKCVHGCLPHPSVFERFPNLHHLSLANIGVSSLEQFPRLVNMQKLVLSDNRIAGGLECLVGAGLRSLVDLDLSNNRIQYIEDLLPLAEWRLVSLDLYECPVTRVKDYRARVFGLIKSLKYLDKMDAEENETPETDEDDDEEEEEDEGEEDDPGSGEVDGGFRPLRTENGHCSVAADGLLNGDEDEESNADEENEIVANGQYAHAHHESNGFQMVRAEEVGDGQNGEEIEEDDNSSGEEIDEEDMEDEVLEVHDVADSDNEDEDDGVEYEDDEEDDVDEEEVDNEEQGVRLASITGTFACTEGEIDGHEQGEDDADEDDNGETGEEDEHSFEEVEGGYEEEDEDDDEENGSGYLVQPFNQHAIANDEDVELSDMEPVNDVADGEEENEDIYDEEDVDDGLENRHQVHHVDLQPSSSSLNSKRKISDADDESGEEDDMVQQAKLPKNDP